MGKKFEVEAFEKDIQEMMEAIRKVAHVKRPEGVAVVTDDERLHFAPARAELEELAPKLRRLSELADIQIGKQSLDEMDEAIETAAKLKPLLSLIDEVFPKLRAAVADTHEKNRSNAWRTFTAHYSVLATMADDNGELQQDFKELQELFKQAPRAKKAAVNNDGETVTIVPTTPKVANG